MVAPSRVGLDSRLLTLHGQMRPYNHLRRAFRTAGVLCLVCGVAWLLPARAYAQASSALRSASATEQLAQVSLPAGEVLNSPRASLRRFLTLAEDGDFVGAAQVLIPDVRDTVRAADIARRIYDVIRRRVVIDLDSVSS